MEIVGLFFLAFGLGYGLREIISRHRRREERRKMREARAFDEV